MERIVKISAALVLVTLCLGACRKEDYAGKSVRIGARISARSANTKTLYSDERYTVGEKEYERIDWVNGDAIKLAMQNSEFNELSADHFASCNYNIGGITANGRYSEAKLTPVPASVSPSGAAPADKGLCWGTGSHFFWAAYPATATVGERTVSGNYPASQELVYSTTDDGVTYFSPDMNKAYMVAGLATDAPEDHVDLDFYPAMTTFDFTVGANTDLVITAFEMETVSSGLSGSNVYLTGDFTASFDSNMNWTFSSSNQGQSIVGVFSSNVSVSPATTFRFKIFALPQDITGITIKFTDSNGVSRSLKLKQNDDWIVFPACVKANIRGLLIPGAIWYIDFEGPYVEQWTEHAEIEIGVE